MKILDLSAGSRAIWFDKKNPLALFIDKRAEVNPDIVMDSRNLPASWTGFFDLICWDPPHMNCGPKSNFAKVYGHSTTAEILDLVEQTAKEAHRVCVNNGFMAFKWNTHDISLKRVLGLMPNWEPLFGHITKDGPGSMLKTYWVLLRNLPE